MKQLDLGIPIGVNYRKRLASLGIFADKMALFRFAHGPNRQRRLIVRCQRYPKGRALASRPFAKNGPDLPRDELPAKRRKDHACTLN